MCRQSTGICSKRAVGTNIAFPSTTKGVDSIVQAILVENPDFSDLDALAQQIEKGVAKFIEDIDNFLSKHPEQG